MKILIPAFEPDIRLINLVKKIKALCEFNIVIVDDGSGKNYASIFDQVEKEGCTVIKHFVNFGKGNALKSGIKFIAESGETEGIVTADCDGQHSPEDIIKIANEVKKFKDHIILGSRKFAGKIPFKSRFGNTLTKKIYYFTTGQKIDDTQTGLRGFSSSMFDWLIKLKGHRFEYEMNMLLEAESAGYSLHEITIKTIYYKNHSTHFKAIEDSIRIYLPIIKFSISSLSAAAIDCLLLLLIHYATKNLLLAIIVSRLFSSLYNFVLNKTVVFSNGKNTSLKRSLFKYYILVLVILVFNYLLLYLYYEKIGLTLIIAKILTESTIFIFSYWCQRKIVFKSSFKKSTDKKMIA